MKRIKSLFSLYISLFAFTIILQSCCQDTPVITIIGAEDIFFAEEQELPITVAENATTLTGLPFTMSVNMELEFAAIFNGPILMSSAWATSCDETYLNSLDAGTVSVSCDKDFSFDGDIISAGSSFQNIDELLVIVNTENIIITATEEFMNLVEFENGQHTFTISITTSDGLDLESTGNINISI